MSLLMKSALGARLAAARPARRQLVKSAAARETWYPGATPPPHLNGTLPGDYGFDPLRLGQNPETLKYFAEAEIINGRWAMTAVVGILVSELLGKPKFWLAGAESYPIDNATLAVIELAVFGVLEGLRYNNYKKTGSLTKFIDPANMASERSALQEVKNGRLAMLAFVGFFSGAAVYGKGPIELLQLHLADPSHNNIFTSSVGPESAVTVAVLSVWPIIIEATKTIGGEKAERPALFPWTEPWKESSKPTGPGAGM